MDENMKLYYDYTVSPLGKLFYATAWKQMGEISGKKILDFGSGFGFTANHLAEKNQLIAIEKESSMIAVAERGNNYEQIQGDFSSLKELEDNSFDFIVCHLVFEFIENQQEILQEFHRLLKPSGRISLIRHNKLGRTIQVIVQDYDLKEAKSLLSGGNSYSSAFGDIKYYENKDLESWSDSKFHIFPSEGIRTLASLHDAETMGKEHWLEDMLVMELELQKLKETLAISYFHHVLLEKKQFI